MREVHTSCKLFANYLQTICCMLIHLPSKCQQESFANRQKPYTFAVEILQASADLDMEITV